MFKSLRSKFIAITVSLVGLVLAGVLGATLLTAWNASREEISRSLDMALEQGTVPQIGIGHARHIEPDMNNKMVHVPVLVLNAQSMDENISYERNESFIEVDEDDIEEVVQDVFQSKSDTGTITETHIAWKRQAISGGWRIAIADTEVMSESFRQQAITDLFIFAVAIGIISVAAFYLSTWALTPVQDAWDAQKRFVADASHELKTPLSVILANSEILSSKEDVLGKDAMRWVHSTADEAHYMHAMVEELLQLARADEMQDIKDMRSFEDLDFSALVEKVALQFDAVAFEAGTEIETKIEPGIHITCDKSQVENLVATLIENSCKYAKPNTKVEVVLSQRLDKVKLQITNYGDIIPAEDLPHVFDRFWRSDTARTREKTGGYGLGLAIAKAIVEAHEGQISVTSTPESGTTFCVTL